ncbi:hypothetical protein HMPREF1582_00373 [Gardnerella vaginalis JCP8151A]|nr:hypothetical protein HMPREF1582_00373 [Gardnerella vaginalis JCP8151A]
MSKECEKRRCKLCKKSLICEKWLCKRCYLDAKNKFYFIAGTAVVGAGCLSVFSKNADVNKNKDSSKCDNSNED